MTQLPVTDDLVLDLAVASVTVGFGGTAANWRDTSDYRNTGYYVDQQPKWNDGQTPNGSAAVRFDGQARLAYDPNLFAGTTNPFAGATAGAEIFAVVRATAGAGDNFGFYRAGGGDSLYPNAAGQVVDGSLTTAGLFTISGIDTTQWHVYNVYHTGTQRVTEVDGVVVHTAPVAFAAPAGLYLGAGVHDWKGDIAAFAAYQRALTSTERGQVRNYLTGLYFNALPPADPIDPNDPPPGPDGLALISGVHDAFDENALDTTTWYSPDDTALLGNGHLTLTGTLQTASGGYNIDAAFVHLQIPPVPSDDGCWASFMASVPFGSPPTSWGFNIFVNGTDGTAQITASWANDDGTAESASTIAYDPVAHAWLRLRSVFEQVSGDWLLTTICEAGPTPGQWTQLMRSPQLASSMVSNGFQIVFNTQFNNEPAPIWLSDFNVADTATSLLYQKQPDGSFLQVGVTGQPVQFRLPDGSYRTWPGSAYPLYQKQNDGSWLQVIG